MSEKITFAVLQVRLIRVVSTRIRNGDFTERGLARIVEVSQPQVHNVLKGVRKMQPWLGDRLLQKLDMTILDLLDETARREVEVSEACQPLKVARMGKDPELGADPLGKKHLRRKLPGKESRADLRRTG